MADTTPIPEDRLLTEQEASLVRWMLEHGKSSAVDYLSQLAGVRVVSRCHCGCASVNFSVAGVVPNSIDRIGILADFEYRTAEGHRCGVFVFERAGLLAGLDVWSVDGLSTPSSLPGIGQLHPLECDK
jgi:hypothetical protein